MKDSWKPCNNCKYGVTAQDIYENMIFYSDMPNTCYECYKEIAKQIQQKGKHPCTVDELPTSDDESREHALRVAQLAMSNQRAYWFRK